MASLINALSTAVSPYVMPVVEKNLAPDFLVRFGELCSSKVQPAAFCCCCCCVIVSTLHDTHFMRVSSSVAEYGSSITIRRSFQAAITHTASSPRYCTGVRRQCGHRLQEIAKGTSVEQVRAAYLSGVQAAAIIYISRCWTQHNSTAVQRGSFSKKPTSAVVWAKIVELACFSLQSAQQRVWCLTLLIRRPPRPGPRV